MAKPEQERRFHSDTIHGTDAAILAHSYANRLQMEKLSPLQGLKWRNIGPEIQGGRVVDITAPLGDPHKLYVAYATGGLWRTEDDGITWQSLFDNQSAFGIGAIAVSRDGKTLWVGTGEANSQRTSYAGTGIFKSIDSGQTWTNMGLPDSQHVGKILIDPHHESTVYVAVLGHLYSRNPERGVYKTTDGGKTWEQILKVNDHTGAIDLVMDPQHPEVILASMWERDRRAWDFQESGASSAVYRTTNGGETWLKVSDLPVGYAAGRTGLAICRSKPKVVYAFVDNQAFDPDWANFDDGAPSGRLTPRRFLLLSESTVKDVPTSTMSTFLERYVDKSGSVAMDVHSGKLSYKDLKAKIEERDPNAFIPETTGAELYRSDDTGRTWHKTETGNFGGIGGYYWGKVEVNPEDPNDIAVMGLPLIRSADGGRNWTRIAGRAHVDFHAVWHDPENPHKMWIGCDGGLYVSPDDGKTVVHVNNVPTGQATTLALDNKIPYNVYIGLQDNGTMRGPSSYVLGRSDPNQWKDIGGGDGSAVVVDPRKDGETVYTASQFGDHSARNQTTNESWATRPSPPKDDPKPRFNWISPITLSSFDPDIVYVGAQRLYRSFDMGHKFEPISPDLTKNKPNGNVPYSTLKDISESPFRFGLIYVGADDGSVRMTPDGGFQWMDISTPSPLKWVSRVVASKWDVNTVYVAQSGYREDDFAPYLWKSTDQGKTWHSITANLPMEPINVVREDPNHKDMLYVGTDMGVFVSLDAGATWEPMAGGMPHIAVHDLAVQPRDNELVAATHGRSVYAISLKEVDLLTPELRKKTVELFDIPDASRSSSLGYETRERWDTSMLDAPTAVVTFYVADPGKAVLRIKDDKGKMVREQSFDAVRGFNVVQLGLQLTTGRIPKPAPQQPAKTAQDALKDPYAPDRATFLALGTYMVELEHAGTKVEKKMDVVAGASRGRFRRSAEDQASADLDNGQR